MHLDLIKWESRLYMLSSTASAVLAAKPNHVLLAQQYKLFEILTSALSMVTSQTVAHSNILFPTLDSLLSLFAIHSCNLPLPYLFHTMSIQRPSH
jgi:hypothetical protein